MWQDDIIQEINHDSLRHILEHAYV